MSYFIGNNEYEFLSISENEMHVRVIQTEPSGATLAWYEKFSTTDPNDDDGDCNGDTGEVGSGNNDVLIWAEEFETDGAPCSGIWNYDLGANGWGNNESQFYTNRHENIINEALVERASNRTEHESVLGDIDCLKKQQEKTDNELLEYKMVKKYPKFAIVAMFMFGGCLVALTLAQLGVF
jgi:hypothetical protein